MVKKEGIGSYFHFEEFKLTKGNDLSLPFDYEIFYTGRHALLYILDTIKTENKISKIWFPNYYCQHTLDWIKKKYPDINLYEINPFDFSSDIINISEFADKDDIVVINNFWGLSTMTAKKNNNSPIIIEDHSHGWLSKACLSSNADYCFVSLRKSLPIPLGGIYWRPNKTITKKHIDFQEDKGFYEIWELMLQAMTIKTTYIKNKSNIGPENYLPLFYEVEKKLNNDTRFIKLNEPHKKHIEGFLNFNTLQLKERNLNKLYSQIDSSGHFKVVKRLGYTAFGLHLVFKEEAACNSLKTYLVKHKIYPSMLWPHNTIDYKWQFFMNIHVDFRYNKNDMSYIIKIINSWISNYKIR